MTNPRAGEGFKIWSGRRDLNPRLRPWQGRTLPLSYSRSTVSILDNAPCSVKPANPLNCGFAACLLHRTRPLRVQFRPNHLAVAQVQNAIAETRRLRVVGDHQHGLAQFPIGALQHLQYRGGILGVEVSGRLVGQHNRRFVDQGSGQGDALLFAAAQFAGAVIEAFVDAKQPGDIPEVFRIVLRRIAGNVEGNLNIVAGRKRGQQVELLKYEANLSAAAGESVPSPWCAQSPCRR